MSARGSGSFTISTTWARATTNGSAWTARSFPNASCERRRSGSAPTGGFRASSCSKRCTRPTAEALGRRVRSANPLIVYQGHNPQFAQIEHLILDFSPNLKFVHCVREPLPSLGSWLAHVRSGELGGALDLSFRVLGRAIDHAKPILNQWPGDGAKPPLVSWNERNTRAVRLEDLHQRPRETLERLCAWLDIPWDDALLQSTFDSSCGTGRTGDERSAASSRVSKPTSAATSSPGSTASGSGYC